jgi:hypothetical protein
MNMDKNVIQQYINKKVQFFPNDTYYKAGYIIGVDDAGIAYEVTESFKHEDQGMFFRNHASNFCFKLIEK